jgi:hypothetical protein
MPLTTYENGMKVTKAKRDNHAFSELQAVYRQANGLLRKTMTIIISLLVVHRSWFIVHRIFCWILR